MQHDEAASAPITPPAARNFCVRGKLVGAAPDRVRPVWF
jgi:hypothetical protein